MVEILAQSEILAVADILATSATLAPNEILAQSKTLTPVTYTMQTHVVLGVWIGIGSLRYPLPLALTLILSPPLYMLYSQRI
jgi:hypothetical protein